MTYNASTAEEKLDIIDLPRLRALVESRTEAGAFGYVDGGSSDEQVLQDNETAFRHYQLIPRMLQNIAEPDMTTTLFDIPLGMPIIAAPIAAQGLMHEGGESVTVKGVCWGSKIYFQRVDLWECQCCSRCRGVTGNTKVLPTVYVA